MIVNVTNFKSVIILDTPVAAEDGSSKDLKRIGCKRKVVKLIPIIV